MNNPLSSFFTHYKHFVVALLICWFALFFPHHVLAQQQINLYKAEIVHEKNDLSLLIGCSVADEDALRDLLKDGAIIELTITAFLEEPDSWFSNTILHETTFATRLGHDQLTREFTLLMPEHIGGQTLKEKNLTRLLARSWRDIRLPLLKEEDPQLEPKTEYLIIVQANLQHVEVPPWLEQSTLFWSSEVATQVTVKIKFIPEENIPLQP